MKKTYQTPTLSLCMIVKNEEKFLPQCLESVQGVVDEIIIVDTGSTDRTVEIAENYHAQVYHHPWEGNFSKARNISLGYATSDWILVLDADEELEREDIPIIKSVINSNQYDVIFCGVLSTSYNGDSKNYSHRIFRRGKAHYEGIVHNQLIHEGTWLHTNIRIYHYGYNLSKEEMQAKYRRTESLLKKQLEEDPSDPFAFQNYIRVLRVQNRDQEAVEIGLKALDICVKRMNDLHYQMIASDTAFSLLAIKKYTESENLIRQILQKYPKNLDVNFALGLALQGKKQYQNAIDSMMNFIKLNKELKKNPQHTRVLIDTFDFEHRAWGNISDCYFNLKEYVKSNEAIEKAISLQPEIPVYRTAHARILIELGKNGYARSYLTDYEQKGKIDPVFYEKWAGLCIVYPDFGNPVEVLENGLAKFPDSIELRNILATRILPFDMNRAECEWKKILENNENHIGAHFGMVTIYAKQQNKEMLLFHADIILQKAEVKDILKQTGGYCMSLNLLEKAIELLSKYLKKAPDDVDALVDVATCYAKLKKFDAAFSGYKSALLLSPGNPAVIKNLQILQHIIQNTQN